ncbi:hypothetical protein PHLCEN_2v3527 [Hermanssonia centrifuga]|uniref:Uncharacterized protein n=1 Tax=Hermanssonia centrifuga TaxID=98765 RepID=A0A2R6QEW5_9APHY|nr:hypothetical protein PHLCEN_2v3527 [Hermanssonia centrifuga]
MTALCACGRNFPNDTAIAIHQKVCRQASSGFLNILKRKREAEEQKKLRKRQCREALAAEAVAREQAAAEAPPEFEHITAEFSDVVLPTPDTFSEAIPSGRHPRVRRAPKRVRDFLPSSLTSLRGLPSYFQPPPPPPSQPTPSSDPSILTQTVTVSESIAEPSLVYIKGKPNAFGLYRSYLEPPIHDPEASLSLDNVCDSPTLAIAKSPRPPWWSVFGNSVSKIRDSHFTPFLNATTFRLMSWFYSGSSMKSLGELDRLVQEVIMQEDFNRDDLHGFSATREGQRVDEWIDESSATSKDFCIDDGWHEASVKIPVPCERTKWATEGEAPLFEVPGIFHRRLIDIIKTTLSTATAQTFHMVPFKLWLSPPNTSANTPPQPQRVFSELYNSEAMNDEYEKIRAVPRTDGCQLETVIASIMLWSDSTHLAQFGNASLWPIYAFFGNQSKYVRCKPTEFAAHHLAYIPSVCTLSQSDIPVVFTPSVQLPDTIQDWYEATFGKAATAAVLTHCKRELMHAIWMLLLDDEFMHAYEHGVVIMFADGIARRVFPRIFTYSADYPEKILLATIRYLATCPCPRCLIPKVDISAIGTKLDSKRRQKMARTDDNGRRRIVNLTRTWIFERGLSITSKYVNDVLGPRSWVPTRVRKS